MNEQQFSHLVILFSFKDDETGRKDYEIVSVKVDGYVFKDGQALANSICAYGKALAALKGFPTFFALDFRYCDQSDLEKTVAEIQEAIRMNADICNIYDGFYSSVDLRPLLCEQTEEFPEGRFLLVCGLEGLEEI